MWALGVRPDYQHLALGPLLYREIIDRLVADGIVTAEASWTLATNHRINGQMAAMGARRSKVWRLYGRPPSASRLRPDGGPDRPVPSTARSPG